MKTTPEPLLLKQTAHNTRTNIPPKYGTLICNLRS